MRALSVVFVVLALALLLSTRPQKADGRVYRGFKVLQSDEFPAQLMIPKTGTNRAYFPSRSLAKGLVPPAGPNPDTYIPHEAHARHATPRFLYP
ncbi:hypothetical protein RHSIM_Rhsim12G0035100 [Rhododendron simsii]|uniref:Uncharacterized protein n=1 Tax=Rhododendron simsii TaxID=118357 RepID=A0A834G1S6_RHOSS|nr:hypothetical protein RHSIM_Rhsim12G0035100 [Rhododendron simsii]